MPAGTGFSFGPFHLDVRSRRLRRDDMAIDLPARQFDLLATLVVNPGVTLSKDLLTKAAWRDVAVGDNSLVQAISQLRARLDENDDRRYIRTVSGRGYCFVAPVVPTDADGPHAEVDALLAPYRALLEGRAALETLERPRIATAKSTFERLLTRDRRDPRFHVGLANACVLLYESTRAEPAPDTDALRLAVAHAREACRLDPKYGEAWATLGFVLDRAGQPADALAALHFAVDLEPDNWRHLLRLSYGSWGDARLRAGRRTLSVCPRLPMAHLLVATVYVGRGALAAAESEIDAALAAMTSPSSAAAGCSTVAVHWLNGLLLAVRGRDDDAVAAFERELAGESRGHLYARECCANAWYAIGACRLRQGEAAAARAGFEQAIVRLPRHPMARAGLLLAKPGALDAMAAPLEPAASIDVAIARAALRVAHGDVATAVRLVGAALAAAPPGNAGWLVPIDPLLGAQRDLASWAPVLAALHERAM
ncbi:MAG: winged helix-turn-helix domain-containing protein [Acidobacteria bacterium]|nr:winged helix-turn-helix domain-containing protein [Acidobacteriota bacterium]